MKLNKTFLPKKDQIVRNVYLIDAADKVLGRVAAKAATLIRGKHKVIYTQHIDTGDTVVIINAAKIKVTGKKLTDKIYKTYSGYPSGLKVTSLENLLKKSPARVMRNAVSRMIPKGAQGYHMRTRLRVYADDKHPHAAQKPIVLTV